MEQGKTDFQRTDYIDKGKDNEVFFIYEIS
jgi:hypothetical protein